MAHTHIQPELGSVKYLFGGVLSLVVVLAGVTGVIFFSAPGVDVEKKRGDHRIEVRQGLRKEEEAKLLALEKPEWVNAGAGIARIPIAVAIDHTANFLKKKEIKASAVKVDPVLVMGADAPKMPSSPSGAATIRFPALPAPAAAQPAGAN